MVDRSPAATKGTASNPVLARQSHPARRWAFIRRPAWLLSHVLVTALIIAMLAAGLWQIDRHRDRSARNDLIEARTQLDPVAIESIVGPGADPKFGESEQFRPVVASGRYAIGDEVLVRNRTLDGAPGWWVLTPLVNDEGWAVIVNRGWIPLAFEAGEARPGTEPPGGAVEVVGWIQPTRTATGFEQPDPAEGLLESLARPDIERLARQVDYSVVPLFVQVAPSGVGAGELPVALDLPPLDSGPHLSYAVQWFVFTTIAIVGYPLVLRRVARDRDQIEPDAPEPQR